MQTPCFSERTIRLLDRAEIICGRSGSRLTELRRLVLGLVLDSEKPAGAYDLLDRLRDAHKGAAPPTIYRALDFLLEQGLIHKVERLSAFIGCLHDANGHDGDGPHRHHAAQFLICTRCGRAAELDDHAVEDTLAAAARAAGFVPHRSTVEVEGLCARCAALPEAAVIDASLERR